MTVIRNATASQAGGIPRDCAVGNAESAEVENPTAAIIGIRTAAGDPAGDGQARNVDRLAGVDDENSEVGRSVAGRRSRIATGARVPGGACGSTIRANSRRASYGKHIRARSADRDVFSEIR